MSDQISSFDFEQYQPREAEPISTSRRGLLRALMSEVHAYSGKVDGKPILKLADLAALTDEELAIIRPVRVNECKINLREKMVWAFPPDRIEPLLLFPIDSPALRAFNLFDGFHTLEEISQALVEETAWAREKAWAYTRGLFLYLVNAHVCVPK